MRLHRFLANKVTMGGYVFVEGREVYHARNVLRLKKGSKLIVFDRNNNEYECELLRYHSKEKMELKILQRIERDSELKAKITLIIGLCRSKSFEIALQKCTELGAYRFIPLETQYSIIKAIDAARKVSRWSDILLDAAKQSVRTYIPKVSEPIAFADLITTYKLTGENTIFCGVAEKAEAIESADIDNALKSIDQAEEKFIIVGPEGGFSQEEIAMIKDAGIKQVSLGNRVLRTETAAIFVMSIASNKYNS